MKSHSQPQGKKLRIKGKERGGGRKGRGKQEAGCWGRALCGPHAHPAGTGSSLSPQDTAATPGPTGLGLLPPKNWQGHHPGLAGRGNSRSPHVQARLLDPRVPGAAVSATSLLPYRSANSRQQAMFNAQLGSTKPLLFLPQLLPAHPRRSSPGQIGGI